MISCTTRDCSRTLRTARSNNAKRLYVGMIVDTSMSKAMLSDLLKRALYGSGILGLYHRVRNARTLTVVMFHRVLEPDDPRWFHCDPDYTLRADIFSGSLRFFRSHYNVVSLDQVVQARQGKKPLPPRALLITFDDGWADNVDFALPRLREAGMGGVMFVVADAVDRAQPFYQEQIVSAWRRGTLRVSDLAAALQAAAPDAPLVSAGEDLGALRRLIAGIEALPLSKRRALLEPFKERLADGMRHMVTQEELLTLDRSGVAIGLHGKSHVPMTEAEDLRAELGGARAEMAARLVHRPAPATLSFPHGRYDASVLKKARLSGYELVFTSVPVVNPSDTGVGWLLGRLGFDGNAVVDEAGRFRPDRLALYLFRKPLRRLG